MSETRTFACSIVGSIHIAVDIAGVQTISDRTHDLGESLDAAYLFGDPIEDEQDRLPRRCLRLDTSPPIDLIVGWSVNVVEFTSSDVSTLPPFIAGVIGRGGVSGLVLTNSGVVYVLDPARLEPLVGLQ